MLLHLAVNGVIVCCELQGFLVVTGKLVFLFDCFSLEIFEKVCLSQIGVWYYYNL